MPETDWEIYFHKLFQEQYHELIKTVEALQKKNPKAYKLHSKTKLLARLHNVIYNDVLEDPLNRKFQLSNTLKKHKEWRRVKSGLPSRYRLFFRFYSKQKRIVFVWMNEAGTLRAKGGKYDVYTVFEGLLEKGEIPSDYKDLFKDACRAN